MRDLLLNPLMRQGAVAPKNDVPPWYKIVNKGGAKDKVTKVYIYDVIGGWFGVAVQDFVKELNDIETDEVHVHINSPGGSVYDGISIYNALRQHDSTVHTYVDGLAASAASFIAQAGEKRVMGRNATMMIHDAIGACYGNRKDMLDTAAILDRVSDNIADIYAKNAGGDSSEWRELMKAETWYTGSEAKDAGLCDEVLDADEEDDEADTENKWDLTNFFNYAGREFAPSPLKLREQVRNQLKEARMSGTTAPKNEDGKPEGTPTEEKHVEPVAEAPVETGPAEEKPVAAAAQAAATLSVLVNGTATNNLQAVQNHINSLETFRSETIKQARTDFVTNLATQNKIPATQIDSLTEVALDMSDEQYAKWKASYDAAPAAPLFGNFGITPGDQFRPANQSGGESVQDEIKVLEQIVADHRRAGMPKDVIESKESYKKLQALKSQLSSTN